MNKVSSERMRNSAPAVGNSLIDASFETLTKSKSGSNMKVLKPPALTLFGHGGF